MIQQGVWFLFSLRSMRWASAHSSSSVSSGGGRGCESKEIREWLCNIVALCVAVPLVMLVAHVIFTTTLSPAPPPPDEHEVMCHYAAVYNDTVREHHIANHFHGGGTAPTSIAEKVINVDVVYLRYRIDCTIAKRYRDSGKGAEGEEMMMRRHIYTLDAFGTTEHDIVSLLNATHEANRLYPTEAPPFRRWEYDNEKSGGGGLLISETPDVMGWGYWLARWLYYIVLLSGLAPLSYLVTCTLTLYCPLPLPLIVLAIRARLWLFTQNQPQSCV